LSVRRSLDDVRDELRALGYLKDPIGGFVAPHSRGSATFLRASLLTSLRSGLLAGLILAAPLALALARLSRPHVQGGRDIAILAAYLFPILVAAVASVNGFGDLIIGWLTRRGRHVGRGERLAARLGGILGGAVSLYLALVWRHGARDGLDLAVLGQMIFVAGAGWIVGWSVRGGALFVVAAAGGKIEPASSRARGSAPILLAALLGAAGIVFGAVMAPRPDPPRPMPHLVRAGHPGRLFVVGLDGLDDVTFRSLVARADVRSLREILGGAAIWTLRAPGSLPPPEIWTTFATGFPGEIHGVRSFEVRRLPGMRSPLVAGAEAPAVDAGVAAALKLLALIDRGTGPLPLSSGMRRCPALWEILDAAGAPSAVVNWWGTWPAEAEGGVTVSDRALGAWLSGQGGRREGAAGEYKDDGMAHPPPVARQLQSEFPELIRRLDADHSEATRAAALTPPPPFLRDAFVADGFALRVAEELLSGRSIASAFVYLPGQDILLGGLISPAGASEGGEGPDAARLQQALAMAPAQEVLLREMDRGVAAIRRGMKPEDRIVLLVDPGRFYREARGADATGLLVVFGGGTVRGGVRGEMRGVDVAPTLLALAGVPLSAELPGVPAQGLGEEISRPEEPGRVATYGDRVAPPGRFPESDEALERLRSLGYIQ